MRALLMGLLLLAIGSGVLYVFATDILGPLALDNSVQISPSEYPPDKRLGRATRKSLSPPILCPNSHPDVYNDSRLMPQTNNVFYTVAGSQADSDDKGALLIISNFINENPKDSLTKILSASPKKLTTLADIFEYIFETDDDFVRYQCIRLAHQLAIEDPVSARRILSSILERDPSNLDAIRSYSLIFEAHENSYGYADFIRAKMIDHPEISSELRMIMAEFFIQRGEQDQAIALVKDAMAEAPHDDYYSYLLKYYENIPFNIHYD